MDSVIKKHETDGLSLAGNSLTVDKCDANEVDTLLGKSQLYCIVYLHSAQYLLVLQDSKHYLTQPVLLIYLFSTVCCI